MSGRTGPAERVTEWLLAVNLTEAEEMERAAGGTRTFAGLQGRSSPTFRWLADLVSRGYVGDLLSATAVASSTEWGTPVTPAQVYTLDRELGATMLTIAFGHAIDTVAMVVGELQEVVATTATRRPQGPSSRTSGRWWCAAYGVAGASPNSNHRPNTTSTLASPEP